MTASELSELVGRSADAQQLLDERARLLARPIESQHGRNTSVHVIVRLGEHRLAISVERIRRVGSAKPITPAPSSVPALVGIVQMHGHVLPVVDLSAALDVTTDVPHHERQIVVVDDRADGVALLVDELEGLADVEVGDTARELPLGNLTRSDHGGPRRLHVDALIDMFRASQPPEQADISWRQP